MRMWFAGEYLEVVQNKRLVYTDSMSDEDGNMLSLSDMGMQGVLHMEGGFAEWRKAGGATASRPEKHAEKKKT